MRQHEQQGFDYDRYKRLLAEAVDERKRLAESLRGTVTAVNAAIADLEKAEK